MSQCDVAFDHAIYNGLLSTRGTGLVVIFLSPSYLHKRWPLIELGVTSSMRSNIRMLPILILDTATVNHIAGALKMSSKRKSHNCAIILLQCHFHLGSIEVNLSIV